MGWLRRCTVALCLVSAVSLSCYKQTIVVGAGSPTTSSNKVDKRFNLYLIGGLVGRSRVQVACPSNNATVYTEQNIATALIKVLTGGLVAPTTTTTWCQPGQTQTKPLSTEEVQAILSSPVFIEAMKSMTPEQIQAVRNGLLQAQSLAASESASSGAQP